MTETTVARKHEWKFQSFEYEKCVTSLWCIECDAECPNAVSYIADLEAERDALLEACEAALQEERWRVEGFCNCELCKLLEAAIARARGGTP